MRITSDDRPGHRRRGRVWIAVSVVALAVGGLWSAAIIANAVSIRLDNDRALSNPTHAGAVIRHIDSSDEALCVAYSAGGHRLTPCLSVDDPDGYHLGQQVRVTYNRLHPTEAVVDGDVTQTWTIALLIIGVSGAPLLAFGLVGLAHGIDLRSVGGGRPSWWIAWTTLGGVTTWIAFLYVGRRARRTRWVGWAVVYLVAMIVGVALDPLGSTSGPASNLGLVLVGLVWVGGMVHAMVIRGRAAGAAREYEHPTPIQLPPLPMRAAFAPPPPFDPRSDRLRSA